MTIFVAKHLADNVTIRHVRFEQTNEQFILFRTRFERLQNNIEHTIWIQIEAA